MITQASSSKTTLASHLDSTVVPSSPQLRRLLYRLDKSELIKLALRWLTSGSPSHIPPLLSKRLPKVDENDPNSSLMHYHAILDLNEERRARSLDELKLLWSGPMADPKVPKARALDRITQVDWPEGITYGMIAEIDLMFSTKRRTSRTWTAIKLECDDDVDANRRGYERLSPQQIQDRFSRELSHYFEHHVFLQTIESGSANRQLTPPPPPPPSEGHLGWANSFTYLRVVLAPTPSDICANGLHILHIPRSPFLLVSGILGRGTENRDIALSAFAQALGANAINHPRPPPGSLQEKMLQIDQNGQDKDGNRRTLGELRGKDPISLRDILISEVGSISSSSDVALPPAGVAGGGKAREMRSAEGIEDGPLVAPLKRRREHDAFSVGVRLPTPPASDVDDTNLAKNRSITPNPSGHPFLTVAANLSDHTVADVTVIQPPNHAHSRLREAMTTKLETRREARELFGIRKANDQDLPKIERIEYEMKLGFPPLAPYKQPDEEAINSETMPPIKLRIEGTHVLAGLRKLVEAGLDRQTNYVTPAHRISESDRTTTRTKPTIAKKLQGLPGWLTEVRGTKIVVEPASTIEGESFSTDE